MIKPSVGRVVIFRNGASPHEEFAAVVAKVHGDRCVNLMVVDSIGNTAPRQAVTLLQDDDSPAGLPFWCEWMPFQKGQAAKTEAAEANALELGAAVRRAGLAGP